MKDPIIVLLDVDGVLADFRDLYVRCCNEANRTNFTVRDTGSEWSLVDALGLTAEQNNRTWELIKEPGQALHMAPLPGAVEAVESLIHMINVGVYFVTSPVLCPTWAHDRREWVAKHFGKNLAENVIFADARCKALVRGDVFVDDYPLTVANWRRKNGGEGFIWSPIVRTGFESIPHTQDWGDIRSTVEFIREAA